MTNTKKTYQRPEVRVISVNDPKYGELLRALAAEESGAPIPADSESDHTNHHGGGVE